MSIRRFRRKAAVYIWRSPNPMVKAVRLAAVLAVFALSLSSCLSARHPPEKAKATVKFVYPSEDDALTDQGRDGGVVTIPPPSPLPWQKVTPCATWEQDINGACYILMDESAMMPPCAPGFAEHKGRCFQAMRKGKQPSVSGEE